MDKLTKLADAEVRARLLKRPSWHLQEGQLIRSFEFLDFVTAFGFMTSVALIAERLGHHPNWTNVYNRVDISLSTHEVEGISDNDLRLAEEIDQVFHRRSA